MHSRFAVPGLTPHGCVGAGETRESILRSYRYLERADIEEALRHAVYLAEDETIELGR